MSAELVRRLRAAGDPLHRLAADALVSLGAEVEHLQERVYQLEGIARLNVETIRSMQRAVAETGVMSGDQTRRRRAKGAIR